MMEKLREALEWYDNRSFVLRGEAYRVTSQLAGAARSLLDAPEWLQQLIVGDYEVSELPPDASALLVLRVPPNEEGTLDIAQALQRATGRLIVVLEDGYDLDALDAPEAWRCEEHNAEASTSGGLVCWKYAYRSNVSEAMSCRMVRVRLVEVTE